MIRLFTEIPHLAEGRLELRKLGLSDAAGLQELMDSPRVYRYLPTFLFEKQYEDARDVIRLLYTECIGESMILGVFRDGAFCGLMELYGYRAEIRKISTGYRYLERCWGQGIATEALRILVAYLYGKTDTEIITASTMVENAASAGVLRKCGFDLVVHASQEDWGYDTETLTDKWIR